MQRRKKNVIIGMLCCMLVFMGVGYAIFQQSLSITTIGNISSKWNIKITSVTEEDRDGYISDVVMNHDDLNADVSAVFQAPGDWIEFRIKVENQGTIDAVLEEVTIIKNSNREEEYIDVITKEIEAKEELNRGETIEFIVRMELDPDLTTLPSQAEGYVMEATIGLKIVQKGSTTGSSNSDGDASLCYTTNSDGSISYDAACGTEVVVPATAEDGTPITTIDKSTFLETNVTQILDYDEETDEEKVVLAITDEENYNTIKTGIEGVISDVSTSAVLDKDITLTPLNVNEKIGTVIEMSGSGSGSGTTTTIYIVCKFSELGSLGLSENAEYYPMYFDIATKELYEPELTITKLDLSRATNLQIIKESAFEGSPLETIIFGNDSNLLTIEDYAFADCQLKEELVIPASVITIGERSFSYNQISSLVFAEGSKLQKIGGSAFQNNQIASLILPESVTTIGDSAFLNNQITDLTIGKCNDNVCSNVSNKFGKLITTLTINGGDVPDNAFSNYGINNLNLGKVTSIGNSSFSNNKLSGELIIPASVTTVKGFAFTSNQITKLTFEEGSNLQTIGESAFISNPLSGELVIPSSVVTIGARAFWRSYVNSGINYLKFSEDSRLETIGDYAFNGNPISGELTLPEEVTSIGSSAFVSNLITTLNLGNKLTNIGYKAFYSKDGYNLSTINVDMTESDFSKVTKGNDWYRGTPIIKYKEG